MANPTIEIELLPDLAQDIVDIYALRSLRNSTTHDTVANALTDAETALFARIGAHFFHEALIEQWPEGILHFKREKG